jgi:4-hydroxybenzoate polyprenyltransferase
MARLGPVEASLPRARPGPKIWGRALRLHQWAKNALVFVAPVLGGKIDDPAAWIACAVGFLAIGVIASATYLINDLLDLEDDRRHWSKRLRPLAAGTLPLKDALVFAPLALVAGFALAAIAGGLAGVAVAGVYCAGTLAYSFRLKRAPILDVFMLAGLFTLRLAFGVVLAQVAPSPWLLVFSMFLFASLALAKRSTEIERGRRQGDKRIGGRGYLVADAPLVGSLGGATAVAAVLVMVLYLIEEAFNKALYNSPQLLWGLPIVLGLWLGRVWLLCGRGELADDPVAFAVKDRMSLGLGAVLMGCFVGAVV